MNANENICPAGLNENQIATNFGNDDLMKTCKECNNLQYENGMMTCKINNKG